MKCYICENKATSKEHSPAKCFFPKDKRNNLITVKSCPEHNEDTSKDDEYVRNIIAMSIGNNEVAENHFLEECIKTFKRSPALTSTFSKNKKEIYYQEKGEEKVQQSYAFKIERDRFDFILKKIAYGVYFNKYEETWNRELIVGTENLLFGSYTKDPIASLIGITKSELEEPTYEGTNPEIFEYAFLQTNAEDTNEQILVMRFYENFEVWIFPKTDTTSAEL